MSDHEFIAEFSDEAFEAMSTEEKINNISKFTDTQLTKALNEVKIGRKVIPTRKSADPAAPKKGKSIEQGKADLAKYDLLGDL